MKSVFFVPCGNSGFRHCVRRRRPFRIRTSTFFHTLFHYGGFETNIYCCPFCEFRKPWQAHQISKRIVFHWYPPFLIEMGGKAKKRAGFVQGCMLCLNTLGCHDIIAEKKCDVYETVDSVSIGVHLCTWLYRVQQELWRSANGYWFYQRNPWWPHP